MQQSARIISITKGECDELKGKSPQDVISYVARVSNPSNQASFDTAAKLLKYCIINEHWSIFEHVSFTVEIKTTRAIAAQILRHRSFCFQEFSQRYAQAFDFVKVPARSQDAKNRQNSVDNMSDLDKTWFNDAQEKVWDDSKRLYDEAISKGIAKEQARFLLPLNTATTIYMTGNVRSWIHYINLRSDNGTQQEHREIAEMCKKVFVEHLPDVAMALDWI
jgi:thymidylate synthase (FAD)